MTHAERQSMRYAPELAVLHALRATADATCVALAAAHHLDEHELPQSREQALALRLRADLARLQMVVTAYCDHVRALARPTARADDDIPF